MVMYSVQCLNSSTGQPEHIVIFLYRLTVERGYFATLQQSVGNITTDRRLQLLLVAFAFGLSLKAQAASARRLP